TGDMARCGRTAHDHFGPVRVKVCGPGRLSREPHMKLWWKMGSEKWSWSKESKSKWPEVAEVGEVLARTIPKPRTRILDKPETGHNH
ncbi:hypothetical protein E4U43_002976, partial [Claviceps pusilla]